MKRALAALALWTLLLTGAQVAAPGGAEGQQVNFTDNAQAAAGDRFSVPAGFRVELAVRPPADDKTFSLSNCCFDDNGQLLVAKEKGPVLLCTSKDKEGVLDVVKTYCDKIQNCQGMNWIGDALWLVGEGPQGTGLYRCRDTKNAGQIDEVTLLHADKGRMGDNGPHGVIQGPDGMIYFVLGNQAWAQIGSEIAKNGANPSKLAGNSPLTRWPTGGSPAEPGKKKNFAKTPPMLPIGGTIWRTGPDGKNLRLVACGFRNALDAAFAPNGELFTADGDLESEEGLPWFRPVRVCHCPPGADFVWRTDAANTPDYYIDSLPPIAETGPGAAGGSVFYDHVAYPKEYRGAYFLADSSAGVIYAVRLERVGASYKSKVERFCKGAPMPVKELCVGPDGAIYFVLGANKGQGGVYRIVCTETANRGGADTFADWPQPQTAWSQKKLAAMPAPAGTASLSQYVWEQFLNDTKISTANRIRMTAAFQQLGQRPELAQLLPLLKDKDAEMRAHGVWLIGVNGFDTAAPELFQTLSDSDALVRRRSCEALIRIGAEPPVAKVWPLLNEKDRFVQSAARLLLERIDAKKWMDKVWSQPKNSQELNEANIWNGIIALCHTGQTYVNAEEIFGRLHGTQTNPRQGAIKSPPHLLEWLRTIEVALAHCERRPIWTSHIAKQCNQLFPHADMRVNRELAILLAEFQKEGQLQQPIQGRLLEAMTAKKDDRLQQIHYAYCMKTLRTGWTPETAKAMTQWYEGTRAWTGGKSFTPFLASVYKDCAIGFGAAGR